MSKKVDDPIDILGGVYEKLNENAADELENVEEKSEPVLHKIIQSAKEKLIELEEASREDIERVASYLERDLNDAAAYLSESSKEFTDWLGFETELLESEILFNLFQAADPTTLELLKLKEIAEYAAYKTGEITGPGTLICDKCGEELHFYRAGKIPPCPKCHATTFHRKHG